MSENILSYQTKAFFFNDLEEKRLRYYYTILIYHFSVPPVIRSGSTSTQNKGTKITFCILREFCQYFR